MSGEHKYGRLAKDRLQEALVKEGVPPDRAEELALESAVREHHRREAERERPR